MKKLFFSLLVMAATVNAFAITYTAKAKVVLSDGTQKSTLYLLQADEIGTTVDAAYCGELDMEGVEIAFYALYNGVKYETFGLKDLGTLAFGMKTNASTNYSITVSKVEGTPLVMKDNETGETHTLTEGATWNFTATANSTDDTRFVLAAAPAVPGICHQNGKLEFTAYEGASVQVVGYEDNTVVAVPATDITLAYQEIDLATLAAGQYLVIVTKADQTEEKLVIKK